MVCQQCLQVLYLFHGDRHRFLREADQAEYSLGLKNLEFCPRRERYADKYVSGEQRNRYGFAAIAPVMDLAEKWDETFQTLQTQMSGSFSFKPIAGDHPVPVRRGRLRQF